MIRHNVMVIVAFILVLFTFPVSAQDEPHPLLHLLAQVPATVEVLDSEIRYADYAASIETRIGTSRPTSADDAISMIDDNREQFSHYLNGLPLTAIPMTRYLRELVNTPDVLGLDFFKIDQSLMFGAPPDYGTVLRGDFEQSAVITAHESRGYTIVEQSDDLTLLCHEGDCTNGMALNLNDRNLANIFGGEFGRQEPIALTENLVLNSPSDSTLMGMIQTHKGEFDALGDMPAYQAVAQAATADGQLRQMIFWPSHVRNLTMTFDGSISSEQLTALQSLIATPSLPPYSLLAFAEVADVEQEQQRAQVLMVYPEQTTAERAGDVVLERLGSASFVSQVTGQSYLDILLSSGAEQPTARVFADEDTGYFVTMIEFTAPLVTATTRTEDDMLMQSGRQFGRLVDMVYRRDLLWLVVD